MSDLRTAALRALEFIRWSQFVPCQSGDFPEPPSTAPQVEAALVAALEEHDKNREWFLERKANWDLQRKLAEETQERDRQQQEYEEQRLAAPIIQPEIKADKEPRLLPWKGLTEEEHTYYKACGFVGVKAVEEKLRARNSTLACHQGEEGK